MEILSRKKIFLFLTLLFIVFFSNFILGKEKIDINTASKEELQKIIGVGPIIAERIIEARPFSSLYDLLRVKGIGEKTLEKIIEQGLVWVSETSQQPEIKNNKKENKIIVQNNKQQLQQINKEKEIGLLGFLNIFLIALSVAVFSSLIFLVIMKKIDWLKLKIN